MLMIETRRGRAWPVLTCDQCERPIRKAADGQGLWWNPLPVHATRLFFVHKRCTAAFEKRQGGSTRWGWLPLTALPVHLRTALAIDDAAAARLLAEVRSE
jgi:hypothetical protein